MAVIICILLQTDYHTCMLLLIFFTSLRSNAVTDTFCCAVLVIASGAYIIARVLDGSENIFLLVSQMTIKALDEKFSSKF